MKQVVRLKRGRRNFEKGLLQQPYHHLNQQPLSSTASYKTVSTLCKLISPQKCMLHRHMIDMPGCGAGGWTLVINTNRNLQITFLQNHYYHLIFRNDSHDCLFIFVSLTPHFQSTYSSPLKSEHPNKCKEFPTPFILYKWQIGNQTQALTRMTVRRNSHLIFFIISQILKIYDAKLRI